MTVIGSTRWRLHSRGNRETVSYGFHSATLGRGMIDRHWIAIKLKDRPFAKIELARFLDMSIESIDEIINGKRKFTDTEAQSIVSFFGGEGFFSRALSEDQRRLLELSFELTDEEIQFLLKSVRALNDGPDPDPD